MAPGSWLLAPGPWLLAPGPWPLAPDPPMEAFDYMPITVAPVNDAPVAVDDLYAAVAGVPFVATLGGGDVHGHVRQ